MIQIDTMTNNEIKKKQEQVVNLVIDGKLATALPLLTELVYISHQGDYLITLENLESTYKNILKYSFGQAQDPQRETIYNNLRRQLIELCDRVVYSQLIKNDAWVKGMKEKEEEGGFLKLTEYEKKSLIDDLATEKEFSSLLTELDPAAGINSETNVRYSETFDKIFDVFWIEGNYNEGDIQLAKSLLAAKSIPWYDKSKVVSAITISLFNFFDYSKLELLFDVYRTGEDRVSQRALVGIVFALLQFSSRIELYPEVLNRLKTIDNPKDFAKQTEQILIQLIKAQETEKVTEKIQKEIIPEVIKMKPDLEEKLRLDDLLSKDESEDKNPDWQNFFGESSDVYKKLEEFSMMQMDGSDVFMGAFSMLKRFGFFDKLNNWFLPFYKEHPEVIKSTSDVDDKFDWNSFFEGIEQAPVMCNSDKYSFCFNIGFMPDMQKSMMLELFSAELKQMKEVSDDENKHDTDGHNRIVFTQYIQDLYRFHKLHPHRKFFTDIFNIDLDIVNTKFLSEIFYGTDCIRKIGEFYFNKSYYNSALQIFEHQNKEEQSYELTEKIGFCYQKTGNYKVAIEKYKEAEIFDNNRAWLNKKIGYCYGKLHDFDNAIEYYTKVELHEPDNLEVQAYLGQLNIDKENYEQALKYYFKVEYLKPDFSKVQRPIAWCSFLLKKPEQAIRYFEKVVETDGQRSDYLNLAHCYWVSGKHNLAKENYRLALKHSGSDKDWFESSMTKDAIHLMNYKIDPLEIGLMTDCILLEV